MEPAQTYLQRYLIAAISTAMILLVAFGSPVTHKVDFIGLYTGAKLAGTRNQYSYTHAHLVQKELTHPHAVRAYIRPPFYAALTWPLGRLPYRSALLVWQLLNVIALVAFSVLWRPSFFSFLTSCWYAPLWWNLVVGQDMPLLLSCLAVALGLFDNGSPFLAGSVFALCGAKFHLFLLVPLVIVAKRAWSFGAGLAVGAVVLILVSGLIAGWDWPLRNFEIVKLADQHEGPQGFMPNLRSGFPVTVHSALVPVVMIAAVSFATVYTSLYASFRYAIAVAACGSLMISIHSFIYDWVLLLPLIWSISRKIGPGKAIILSALVGACGLAVRFESIALIGQFSPLLLAALAVYVARWPDLQLASEGGITQVSSRLP